MSTLADTRPTRRLPLVILLAASALGLSACGDGEAEMPKDTPASVEREMVSPVGADEAPGDPVTPAERAETAPNPDQPERAQ